MPDPSHNISTPQTPGGGDAGNAPSALGSGTRVDEMVHEIRAGLAHISARELELRRCEESFDRQYQDLKLAAQQAAAAECAETQRRLAQRAAELTAEADEISAQQIKLTEVADQIHGQQIELEQQRADVTLRTQRTRQRAAELRAWQTRQEHILQERARALHAQEEEFKHRVELARAELVQSRAELTRGPDSPPPAPVVPPGPPDDELAARITELAAREAALAATAQRLDESQAELTRQHEELSALREQAEAREHEARHAALLLEVERQSLARPPAVEAPSAEKTGEPATPVVSPPAMPRAHRAWLRLGLAVGVGLLIATAWYAAHPSTYRATLPIQIASARPDGTAVAREHRRELLDPDLLARDATATPWASAWRIACLDGRVTVTTVDSQPALHLRVTAASAPEAVQLVRAAADAYSRALDAANEAGRLPPGYEDLAARRAQLDAALRELQPSADAAYPGVHAAESLDDREELRARSTTAESALATVTSALAKLRADLATLASAEIPLGIVDPAEAERTLAADAIYDEDQKEHGAVALQYRTELSVALLLLVEPLKAVRSALDELAAALAEQRDLQPPADLAAILEHGATTVAQVQSRCAALADQWRPWQDAVQNTNVRDDVAELVQLQSLAAEAARHVRDALVAAIAELGAQVERLETTGDGQTRAVVVGAILRGEQAALKATGESFVVAAGKLTLSENFELDALDRKLRGLHMRLSQREESIRQRLQLDADRAARDAHAARVAQTRQEIHGLEQRREELVHQFAAGIQKLRDMDEAVRRQDESASPARQRQAEIQWLAARRAELEALRIEMLRQRAEPDHVEIGPPEVETLGSRARNSMWAGAAGFVAAWLGGVLATLRKM